MFHMSHDLGIIRDDERTYGLVHSRFKGTLIFLPPFYDLLFIPVLGTDTIDDAIVLARTVDMADMPLTSLTGFSARTTRKRTRHAPLQTVTAVVQMNFRETQLGLSL